MKNFGRSETPPRVRAGRSMDFPKPSKPRWIPATWVILTHSVPSEARDPAGRGCPADVTDAGRGSGSGSSQGHPESTRGCHGWVHRGSAGRPGRGAAKLRLSEWPQQSLCLLSDLHYKLIMNQKPQKKGKAEAHSCLVQSALKRSPPDCLCARQPPQGDRPDTRTAPSHGLGDCT